MVGTKALGASLDEAATGADLGGSSKYFKYIYSNIFKFPIMILLMANMSSTAVDCSSHLVCKSYRRTTIQYDLGRICISKHTCGARISSLTSLLLVFSPT